MDKGGWVFTSEAVTEGHPDKVCDLIADTILDEILTGDSHARVACEVLAGMGFIVIAGEITTSTSVDYSRIARGVLKEVGYTKPEYGFDYQSVGVLTSIHEQSPDIALAVAREEPGAGDQGMMTGYATNETPELMPLPVLLAQHLAKRLADVRKDGTLPYLRPDGKTQVTVEYGADGKPRRAETVVVAAQHDPDVSLQQIRADVLSRVVRPVLGKWLDERTAVLINNTGRFVVGGPVADTGCTGRKIIQDTYGGIGNHGGGAFSGKDASKVDRTAAYYARYIAKNLVAAGLADRVEVQLAYAIGSADALSVFVDPHGTQKVPRETIQKVVHDFFDVRPFAMVRELQLDRPIFKRTTNYG
eukprot:m51a1_g4956 putative s-adenosylmethionine synthetase (359) ;mRNA; r:347250-348435